MSKPGFIINSSFLVDPNTNVIRDIESGTETRLEPRLMQLLCILSDYKGKVLTREFLVKEIWNDYPGGDEGLSQAISFLRKILADEKKRTIETIPKKGYVLYATISDSAGTISQVISSKKINRYGKSQLLIIFLMVMLILAVVIFTAKHSKISSDIPDSQKVFLRKDKGTSSGNKTDSVALRHQKAILDSQRTLDTAKAKNPK